MSVVPYGWEAWRTCGFEDLPAELRRTVLGVDYARLDLGAEGELFLTSFGWPLLDSLLPHGWYAGQQYARQGLRLSGGTGAVYRLNVAHQRLGEVKLVMKFSRFAGELPLTVSSQFLPFVPPAVIDAARFNTPFEEIALLSMLRERSARTGGAHIPTKRPLAIYVPAEPVPAWKLGRDRLLFERCAAPQRADQDPLPPDRRVDLLWDRRYLMLFGWVSGEDAQRMHEHGLLPAADLERLTYRAIGELEALGFRMLDIKPRHLILRRRAEAELLRRRGQLVYALVDFELLQLIGVPE